MDGTANHFPAKNALDRRILQVQSQTFSGDDAPKSQQKRPPPNVWTQIPIRAWLASVTIVPVLGNNH